MVQPNPRIVGGRIGTFRKISESDWLVEDYGGVNIKADNPREKFVSGDTPLKTNMASWKVIMFLIHTSSFMVGIFKRFFVMSVFGSVKLETPTIHSIENGQVLCILNFR